MRTPSAFFRTASPEALFVISGISQYTGAVVAVNLFDDLRPATVAWFRVMSAAVMVLALSWRQQRRWTRRELTAAAVFGVATALMNLFFYLGIDLLPLGKSVVIEFIGPITVAAAFTRTRRNTIALVLAAGGVAVLSGVGGGDVMGYVFIFAASAMWATYIVVGRRVAAMDRGLSGLGIGLAIGSLVLTPFGLRGSSHAFHNGNLLTQLLVVGALSSAVGYAIDQVVMRRIPTRRFALLLALLPVTAMIVGFLALSQTPSVTDMLGAAMVICGVVIQDREEINQPLEELPA
ncbi:MAG: EamA family transporter [Actinomycetota bacterium]|nr:EamA family transporter [Actinomycetota bacterium]